ncbi:hypothetical protein Fot_23132 [Forsythia ovata]|uniref:Uncharacterized protein n=1 Tax=Forsythia ovata TaxID=205694 RepID=A0ABD1UZP6_9LAMI
MEKEKEKNETIMEFQPKKVAASRGKREDKPDESSPSLFQVSKQPKNLTVETLRTILLKKIFHWRRLWERFDIKAMTGRQTISRTQITATMAESESVARDDQLPPLLYVTQTQFNSLETKIETLKAFLHNQTQKAAELAPNSSKNHNGPPHLVEHQNAPPGVQPTGMGQGFSLPDAIPQMGPTVTPSNKIKSFKR